MHLSKIKIKNFRNLREIDIDLKSGLNVIVGENNIGKTNLLTAVRAALNSFVSYGDSVRLNRDDINIGDDGKPSNSPIVIDLYFSNLTEDEQAEFIEILQYNALNPEKSFASIHFEWSWPEGARRPSQRRWGGERKDSDAHVPDEILQSIPTTFLDALRDALQALAPGKRSRISKLLEVNANDSRRAEIEAIFKIANDGLEGNELIRDAELGIQGALNRAAGNQLAQSTAIRSTEQNFEKIVSSLKLVLKRKGNSNENVEMHTEDLDSNGLGYNNLLFIATVLAELESLEKNHQVTMPILLVEEPEAHLHPQLQVLLTDYFKVKSAEAPNVQIILTTHSPTISASVPFELIDVLHTNVQDKLCVADFGKLKFEAKQKRQIQRLLDITRATLFFARGVILVEGISEQLLLPAFAKRLGKPLEEKGISIIPMCGVGFKTMLGLFGQGGLNIPISVVTDGDPNVITPDELENSWKNEVPARNSDGSYPESATLQLLKSEATNVNGVLVCNSNVTLEYDLAGMSDNNALIMAKAWEDCHVGTPHYLTQNTIAKQDDLEHKQLLVWRAICRSNSKIGKGEFSHILTGLLEEKIGNQYEISIGDFVIPQYLRDAIDHVSRENS